MKLYDPRYLEGGGGGGTAGRKGRRSPLYTAGLVFVAMSFGTDDAEDVFEAIRVACRALGLRAERSLDAAGSSVAMDVIRELVKDAEFIVADLTHERPNVYYEIGYADGVGNRGEDVLLIAKKDAIVHFDVGGRTVRRYSDLRSLKQLIKLEVKKMRKVASTSRVATSPTSPGKAPSLPMKRVYKKRRSTLR